MLEVSDSVAANLLLWVSALSAGISIKSGYLQSEAIR